MKLFAAIHVPEKFSFRPAFIDDFGLPSKKASNHSPGGGATGSVTHLSPVEAVTEVLVRHRPLRDLHEVTGAEPLGKSSLDILGVKFDVNAPRVNPFIERQS